MTFGGLALTAVAVAVGAASQPAETAPVTEEARDELQAEGSAGLVAEQIGDQLDTVVPPAPMAAEAFEGLPAEGSAGLLARQIGAEERAEGTAG